MTGTEFDRDTMAKWYANQHLKTDPGIRSVHYLPKNAPDGEIRLIEVNELIGEMKDDSLEPIDFGVDRGMKSEHKLFILDITPSQWTKIQKGLIKLPQGWTLEGAKQFQPR
jgi:hypothetical protein